MTSLPLSTAENEATLNVKLPSNLYSVYAALKQKTDSLATWLILNGCADVEDDEHARQKYECSVPDLEIFAANVISKEIIIPDQVIQDLVFTMGAKQRSRHGISLSQSRATKNGRRTKAMITSSQCKLHRYASSSFDPLAFEVSGSNDGDLLLGCVVYMTISLQP